MEEKQTTENITAEEKITSLFQRMAQDTSNFRHVRSWILWFVGYYFGERA